MAMDRCTALVAERKAAGGGFPRSDDESDSGACLSSGGESASQASRALRRMRQEKARGNLEARLQAALDRVVSLEQEASMLQELQRCSESGEVEWIPVATHLAGRGRALLASLEAHAADCATVGVDIHYAGEASARAKSERDLVHLHGNVARHHGLASDPALDPCAMNRPAANRAQRKAHAKRCKIQQEDRVCQGPDVAAGAATVFYSLTDDEDDGTMAAMKQAATQTELCFDDHNKGCVVACSGLVAIEAGLAMLAQERLQVHELCNALAEELTVRCSSVNYVETPLLAEVCSGELSDCDPGRQAGNGDGDGLLSAGAGDTAVLEDLAARAKKALDCFSGEVARFALLGEIAADFGRISAALGEQACDLVPIEAIDSAEVAYDALDVLGKLGVMSGRLDPVLPYEAEVRRLACSFDDRRAQERISSRRSRRRR